MVNIGDHILYRFEVQKVLGKGSFAQVVSAFDHKTQCNVAIKINRNTEIDHKFAQAEANLLTFLMEEDPQDQHHIVRLSEHLQFREH
jgi:dual specificity tyrosine-phosphorylation-regulated kinase 2/3/4